MMILSWLKIIIEGKFKSKYIPIKIEVYSRLKKY